MNIETKFCAVEHFTNWLCEKLSDNVEQNKAEKFENLLNEYFDTCDFQYEDEFETYDTMRDKTPEVRGFFEKLFGIADDSDMVTIEFWSGEKKIGTRKEILSWLWECVCGTERG